MADARYGKVTIEGLDDLARALRELFPKAKGDKVMRQFMLDRGQPIAEAAASMAPRRTGKLKASIGVGTRLSRRQSIQHKKQRPGDVEVFIGAGKLPQAQLSEFGTSHSVAQPFMRPAWDQGKDRILMNLRSDLWNAIVQAAVANNRKKR